MTYDKLEALSWSFIQNENKNLSVDEKKSSFPYIAFQFVDAGELQIQRPYNRVCGVSLCQLWLRWSSAEIKRMWRGKFLIVN